MCLRTASLVSRITPVLLMVLLLLPAPAAFAAAVQPLSDPDGRWGLLPSYSDEFNGSRLDTAKWDNDIPDWGMWSWDPKNVWVSGGNLSVRMDYSEHSARGKQLYYKSGAVKPKAPPVKYGYFEARIKAASRFPGVCPAFWAFRKDNGRWTEIDFVELTQRLKRPTILDFNAHVFRDPSLERGEEIHDKYNWEATWDPRSSFHVYGCEWNEEYIRWYVDGNLIRETENRYWHQPLDVLISFGLRPPLRKNPSRQGFPAVFTVDYIRVWKK